MSSSSSSGSAFSFDTPQAIMHVLASVRKSDIAAHDKNQLRDLVLAYTNGGKDPSLKIQIEQQLARLAVTPLAGPISNAPAPSAPVLPFGSARSTPGFTVPTQSTTVPTPQPGTTPAPQSVVSEPTPTPTPPPPTPAPTQTVPAPSTPITPPIPPETAKPVPAAIEPNSADLARIREIKAAVNEKIGNPVNLVDIDNAVGREYMSALLEAMKKLSSGASSPSSMQRLEAAFLSVERVLEKPHATPAQATPTPVAAPEDLPVSASVSTSVSASVSPTTAPQTHTDALQNNEPQVVSLAQKLQTAKPATPVSVSTAEPAKEPEPEPVPVAKPLSVQPEQLTERPAAPIEDSRWTAAASAIKPAPIKPLSESTPLKSVADVPTQDSLTNKNDDPMQSKEVTDGLNQLLSDWVLFKKSGLFGTGPKGIEHPLYKSIKDLQIPMLLAGRFDGATQEIKQSITDYMNGWRYEQGIIYEQGETFDHYLRRVIRHILDLQN